MKRLHVNVAVADLAASIRFYSSLFDARPTVLKTDYAKWMLDDPRVNFAITARGADKGVDHLGMQVDTRDELKAVYDRLAAASAPMIDQGATTCCYAHSEKHWSYDPEGIAWETFLTTGESTVYGSDLSPESDGDACCDESGRRKNEPCCAAAIG